MFWLGLPLGHFKRFYNHAQNDMLTRFGGFFLGWLPERVVGRQSFFFCFLFFGFGARCQIKKGTRVVV
jgi:hypothetical protein